MDLFGLQDEGDPLPDTPPWRSLPETTLGRATALMTQLYLASSEGLHPRLRYATRATFRLRDRFNGRTLVRCEAPEFQS